MIVFVGGPPPSRMLQRVAPLTRDEVAYVEWAGFAPVKNKHNGNVSGFRSAHHCVLKLERGYEVTSPETLDTKYIDAWADVLRMVERKN